MFIGLKKRGFVFAIGIIEKLAASLCIPHETCRRNGFQSNVKNFRVKTTLWK